MINKFKQLNQVRKNFLEINWRSYLYYRYVYKYLWRIIDKKYIAMEKDGLKQFTIKFNKEFKTDFTEKELDMLHGDYIVGAVFWDSIQEDIDMMLERRNNEKR